MVSRQYSGTVAADSAGGNDGTLTNFTAGLETWVDTAATVGDGAPSDPFASVLSFNGSTDFVNVAPAGGLATGTGDFTYQAWIRSDTTAVDQTILSIGSIGTGVEGTFFLIDGASGKLKFALSGVFGGLSDTLVNDGEWHHVAVVNSAGSIQLYVDGDADGAPPRARRRTSPPGSPISAGTCTPIASSSRQRASGSNAPTG